MARTKGALNKRTRAALSAAAEGKLGPGAEQTLEYLLKLARDSNQDIGVRMRAAEILLPYCKPKLSAVEQTVIDERDKLSEEEILGSLRALVSESPQIIETLVSVAVEEQPELRVRLIKLLHEPPAVAEQSANVVPLQGDRLH